MDEYRALEKRLELAAAQTIYPPTPDIARRVTKRLEVRQWQRRPRVVWGMAILALILVILVAVPGVRAEIVRILQAGVVQILLSPPEPTVTSPATSSATAAQNTARPTATLQNLSSPTPAYTTSLLPLGAETSLETAAQLAGFPHLLPSYPPDLGAPEKVYYQLQGPVVVMVWHEPGEGGRVQMSLHAIGPDSIALRKHQPEIVQETTVNGGYALWTAGAYLLETASGEYSYFRLVEGHTLIWDEGEITYRLESALPLEEAVRIAESLQ